MQSIVGKRATIDEASNRAVAEAAETFRTSIERLCSVSRSKKNIE